MPETKFEYKEERSNLFGTIKRPSINIAVYSELNNKWLFFSNLLADTGADILLLPRFMGRLIVEDITTGEYRRIRGVVPYTFLNGFIHQLKFKINDKEFEAPVLIADSEDVTPILGRVKGLDLFDVKFQKGESVIFQY